MKQFLFITLSILLLSCSNSSENESDTDALFQLEKSKILKVAEDVEKSVNERDHKLLESLFSHENALIWVIVDGISKGAVFRNNLYG